MFPISAKQLKIRIDPRHLLKSLQAMNSLQGQGMLELFFRLWRSLCDQGSPQVLKAPAVHAQVGIAQA